MMTADLSRRTAERICAVHGLNEPVDKYAAGSLPVFRAGGHVIKLYPSDEHTHFQTELAALREVSGRLSVPTPHVVEAGECDGWRYIVMTRLRGQPLDQAWEQLDRTNTRSLMRQIGAALKELHALDATACAPLAVDWPGFMRAQRASCRQRQTDRGLAPEWAMAIDGFLERWMPVDDGRRVFLHTEVMREHVLAERNGADWHVSGIIDFEPAMLGAPDYEFAAVGVYLACGDTQLLGDVFDGYGAASDNGQPQRLLAYTLLHRYSNLNRYLSVVPAPCASGDLESLARAWFTPKR